MKTLLTGLIGVSLASLAPAAMETWTNKSGKSIQLDLVKVIEKDGEVAGEFRMAGGRTATIKASELAEADAKRLSEATPTAAPTAAAPAAGQASVFDKVFDGDLVKLNGKSLKTCKDATKPSKYYLFYYTASWCGPCHKFTPSLVEFYNKYKPANTEFELVLITSDDSEAAMDGYAAEMKMPWPQLKLSKVGKFKKEFAYPGGGIPNLVLTDLEGKLIKGSYEGKNYVGPTVVMNHLATLQKK